MVREHKSGLHDIVEFHQSLSQFFLKEERYETLHPFIDEYDNQAFWDGLVDRLADRDSSETYGDSVNGMDEKERLERQSPFVEKYEAEVEKHGIDRLRLVEGAP